MISPVLISDYELDLKKLFLVNELQRHMTNVQDFSAFDRLFLKWRIWTGNDERGSLKWEAIKQDISIIKLNISNLPKAMIPWLKSTETII